MSQRPGEAASKLGESPSAASRYASGSTTARRGGSSSSAAASTSAASTASTYVPIQRRLLSLHGTDDRVILDIGSAVTKFGYSGEPVPRGIIPSLAPPHEELAHTWSAPPVHKLSAKARGKRAVRESGLADVGEDELQELEDCLWSYDLSRCQNESERKAARRLLIARVEELIRVIYVQHLKVDPKQRHVLVLDTPSTPLPLREAILSVLFSQFRVPSVAFVPSALMALMAVGRITGLVVDVSGGAGGAETSVTPVYGGRVLETARTVTTTAGPSVRRRLRRLLLAEARYCHYERAHASAAADPHAPPQRVIERVPPELLSAAVVEELAARICLVSRFDAYSHKSPGQAQAAAQRGDSPEALRARYAHRARAKALTVPVASLQSAESWVRARAEALRVKRAGGASISAASSAAGRTGTSSALYARTAASLPGVTEPPEAVLLVPGWVRECAAEVLFEDGDLDESSVPEAVLSSLLKLPIDLRRPMASLILVTGGMAMLPSLPHRLSQQLAYTLQALAEEHDPAAPLTPAVLRRASRFAPLRSLAGAIGVLNDHAPHQPLAAPQDVPPEQRKVLVPPPPTSGSAPVFAANLLPWIGASVVGALQTTSIYQMKRDEWDAEQAALHGPPPEEEVVTSPTKPAHVSRGSFVGVVGGLETGAFGGLAAVSRHLMSPTGEGPKSPPLGRSVSGGSRA